MEDQITLKQLKENLRDTLRNSGVLSSVKAQIRREFVSSISGLEKKNKLSSDPLAGNLHDRIIYSLIYHALLKRKLSNSLSVFIAEYGFDVNSFLLSEMDIVATLQLGTTSTIYKQVMNRELNGEIDKTTTTMTISSPQSILDNLIEYNFMHLHHLNNKQSVSVQTDDSGYSVMELVDVQLKDVRKMYLKRREDERLQPFRSVEERMIIFERECEERYRRDLEIQVAYIRDNEAAKVRLEERQKARLELEVIKREMEVDYHRRLESHHQREQELNRRIEEKERHFQQALYDARQKMQQEVDDLRNREQMISRKMELESQGLNILELRIKESQSKLESREQEVNRREKEVELKLKEMASRSKDEARQHLKQEFESILSERSLLIIDRQKFEEEKGYHTALFENANLARTKLQELQNQLLLKEDEVASYRRRMDQMEARRAEEMNMKNKPGYTANIVTLIHRNAELEAKLNEREDLNFIAKNEEIQRLVLKMKELQIESDMEKRNHLKECELLRQENLTERGKVNALQAKCHELEKQNMEYKNLLAKLRNVSRKDVDYNRPYNNNIDHAKRISDMVENVVGRVPSRSYRVMPKTSNEDSRDGRVSAGIIHSYNGNNNHSGSGGGNNHNNHPISSENLWLQSQQSSSTSSTAAAVAAATTAVFAQMLVPYLQHPPAAAVNPSFLPPSFTPNSTSIPNSQFLQPVQSLLPSHPLPQEQEPKQLKQLVSTRESIESTSMSSYTTYDSLENIPLSKSSSSKPISNIHITESLQQTIPTVSSTNILVPVSVPVPVLLPVSESSNDDSITNRDEKSIDDNDSSSVETVKIMTLPSAVKEFISNVDTTSSRLESTSISPIEEIVHTNDTDSKLEVQISEMEFLPKKGESPSREGSIQSADYMDNFEEQSSTHDEDKDHSNSSNSNTMKQKEEAEKQAILDEQRRQEEDRLAILEAKRKVLDRRNKKLQRDSSDSAFIPSMITSNEDPIKSYGSLPLSTKSSIQESNHSSNTDIYNEDVGDELSVDEEFEAPVEGESASDSSNGWF